MSDSPQAANMETLETRNKLETYYRRMFMLTASVMNKLPRELRDEIYAYLLDEDIVGQIDRYRLHTIIFDVSYLASADVPVFLKHGLGFVSRDFAVEVVVYLHTRSPPPKVPLDQLHPFLTLDFFDLHLSLADVSLSLRSLTVTIDLSDTRLVQRRFTNSYSGLRESLNCLTRTNLRADLELNVEITNSIPLSNPFESSWRLWALYEVGWGIRLALRDLIERGTALKVLYRRDRFECDITALTIDGDLWRIGLYTLIAKGITEEVCSPRIPNPTLTFMILKW